MTAQDQNGQIALHVASEAGCVEVARILVEDGTHISARDERGLTPLHLALEMRHVDIACVLVEHGADMTVKSSFGRTPLDMASAANKWKLIACSSLASTRWT